MHCDVASMPLLGFLFGDQVLVETLGPLIDIGTVHGSDEAFIRGLGTGTKASGQPPSCSPSGSSFFPSAPCEPGRLTAGRGKTPLQVGVAGVDGIVRVSSQRGGALVQVHDKVRAEHASDALSTCPGLKPPSWSFPSGAAAHQEPLAGRGAHGRYRRR